MNVLAFGLGWQELLVIGIVAVLIFGRRLPEVGRDLGKGLMEFKQSLKGVKGDVDDAGKAVNNVRDAARNAGDDTRKLS